MRPEVGALSVMSDSVASTRATSASAASFGRCRLAHARPSLRGHELRPRRAAPCACRDRRSRRRHDARASVARLSSASDSVCSASLSTTSASARMMLWTARRTAALAAANCAREIGNIHTGNDIALIDDIALSHLDFRNAAWILRGDVDARDLDPAIGLCQSDRHARGALACDKHKQTRADKHRCCCRQQRWSGAERSAAEPSYALPYGLGGANRKRHLVRTIHSVSSYRRPRSGRRRTRSDIKP